MSESKNSPTEVARRDALTKASIWGMRAALVGAYGMLGAFAVRFLYPARPARREWMYVAETGGLAVGDGLLYRGPSGETVNIARRARDGDESDFVALSSTCPHLGCQVHWEPHNDRFFCPCHNGEFDPSGKGIGGPPGEAGQSLPRYPLRVAGGLLYIEMPVETLTADGRRERHEPRGEILARAPGIHGAGHDPCLAGRRLRREPDGSLA